MMSRPILAANAIVIVTILLFVALTPHVQAADPERGTATWYCATRARCTHGYSPDDLIAAIDRKDSRFDKGDVVRVSANGRSVRVRIVDVCGCKGRRIIDLSRAAFRRLAPLSQGVVAVTLRAEGKPPKQLPPTDTSDLFVAAPPILETP